MVESVRDFEWHKLKLSPNEVLLFDQFFEIDIEESVKISKMTEPDHFSGIGFHETWSVINVSFLKIILPAFLRVLFLSFCMSCCPF